MAQMYRSLYISLVPKILLSTIRSLLVLDNRKLALLRYIQVGQHAAWASEFR